MRRLEAWPVVVEGEIDCVDLTRLEPGQHVPEEDQSDHDGGGPHEATGRLPYRGSTVELRPGPRSRDAEGERQCRDQDRGQPDDGRPTGEGRTEQHEHCGEPNWPERKSRACSTTT